MRRYELGAQHLDLGVDLDRLRVLAVAAFDELPAARARRLLDRELRDLAATLETHFAFEDEGGYLRDLVPLSNALEREASALRDQHHLVSVRLEGLVRRCADPGDEPAEISRAIVDLVRSIVDHECAEERLLQIATRQDVGRP